MSKRIIAGLDLGTTKVCAVIAEVDDESIVILGFGIAASEGLSRGLIAHISKTAASIKEAMEMAITRSGVQIKQVYVGVAGEHIKSLLHRNYVTINNSEYEITEDDLKRLVQDIRNSEFSKSDKILHIIPEEYIIDGQSWYGDPVGISAKKLDAVSHIVLASEAALSNIKRSVERAGYFVADYMLQPIASSLSVLEEDEKDLGVCLIDIGGGTTDIAVYHRKSIRYTNVIGIAGNHVTNDIRETLGIVNSDAEKIKIEYGYALEDAIIKDEDIFIQGVGGRGKIKIPITLLTQIIHARMKELFEMIDKDLRDKKHKERLIAGIVITGGGSLLKGCDELAASVFGLPARIGVPIDLGPGLSREIERPEFATVAGLIKPFPGASHITSPKIEFNTVQVLKKEIDDEKEPEITEVKEKKKKIFDDFKNSKNTKSTFGDILNKSKIMANKIKDFLNDM